MKLFNTLRSWLASFIIGDISFMKNVRIVGDTHLKNRKTGFLAHCEFYGQVFYPDGEIIIKNGNIRSKENKNEKNT